MEEQLQPKSLSTVEGPASSAAEFGEETRYKNTVKHSTASDSFCNRMYNMMSRNDLELIETMQKDALSDFQKTNEKFDSFNKMSTHRYERLNNRFQQHTRMLVDMKKDLDNVFRRIRNLKFKLSKQYGQAFLVTSANIQKLEIEVENEYKEEKPQGKSEGLLPADNETEGATAHGEPIPSVTMDTSPKTNKHLLKSQVEEKDVLDKERAKSSEESHRTVLRPQLSSSDDSYSSVDTDSVSRENSNTSEEEQVELPSEQLVDLDKKLADQHTSSCSGGKIYRTVLRPELSSSDESLESETDGEESEESETQSDTKVLSTSTSGTDK